MKRIVSILAIIILILSSISITTANNEESQNRTIYVDDDNVNGPWDGSIEYPFNTIQDGINVSNDGDTVFVLNGKYPEFITIDKEIYLLGEKKESTIIGDENQIRTHRIMINHDSVKINGFTIQYSGNGCFGIYALKNDFEISNNIIKHNSWGIWLGGGNGIVSDNLIRENHCGIESGSNNNYINNNLISENNKGVELFGNSCTFTKNQLIGNSRGLLLLHAYSNFILENQIENNDEAIAVSNSDDNIISENNFISNIENTHLEKGGRLKDFNKINKYKNCWNNNYWDEWNKITPKPIGGHCGFYIEFFLIPGGIPILIYPYFEYDKRPASGPFEFDFW